MFEGIEGGLVHVRLVLGLPLQPECFGWLFGMFAFVVGLAVRVASGVVEKGLGVLVGLAVAVDGGGGHLALPVVRPHSINK